MADSIDLLKFIPRSLDENVVKDAQNQGIKASAAQSTQIINADLQNKLVQNTAQGEITKAQDLAQVMLASKINEEQGRLTQEVDGTRQVLQAQGDVYQQKLAEHMKLTQDSEGYSFFTHPIKTIRTQVQLSEQKQQLNDMVDGMDAGNQHIDNEYALSAQRVQDFRATVLNVNQADLNFKAHELQTQTQAADLQINAQKQKVAVQTTAIEKQQYVTDPQKKEQDAMDAALLKNETYKTMYIMTNNGSDVGWNPEVAKVQAQLYAASDKETQLAYGRTTNRLLTLPALQRNDGETTAAFNERRVQHIVAVAGQYDAAAVAEIASGMGTTSLNPLYKLGADTVYNTTMSNAEEDYAKSANINTATSPLTPAQRQMAYKQAQSKIETTSANDKIISAAGAIQKDITNRASMSASAIPPFYQAASSATMASAGVDPNVSTWFDSDDAKQAINHPVVTTGKQAADVILNVMDGLKTATKTGGQTLSDAERATIAATYAREMFRQDYSAHGEHGEAFAGLQKISPKSQLKFQANLKLPQYGGKDPYDLTNPEHLLNLKARLSKTAQDLQATKQQMIEYNQAVGRGIVK